MTITHPAKFSASVLDAVRSVLDERSFEGWILDPFAGTGKVHELADLRQGTRGPRLTYGVELEPEWAALSPYTHAGDATKLPAEWAGAFDAVVTSPPYGNRMADAYAGDGTRRHTYRIALGRPLTEGSAAGMQWGTSYQETMRKALAEMDRVLKPGGLIILNVSDHVRDGQLMPVTAFFQFAGEDLGWALEKEVPVDTPRNRHGANAGARAEFEFLLVMVKP